MTSPFYFNKYQSFTQFGSYSCLQQFPANQTIYFLLKYIVSSYPVKSIKVLSSSLFESCCFFFLLKKLEKLEEKTVAAGQKYHGFSGKWYTLFFCSGLSSFTAPNSSMPTKTNPCTTYFVSRTCVWFRSRVDPLISPFFSEKKQEISFRGTYFV